MARPHADTDVGSRHRQRSNTIAFSSFTAGWRRPRPETVSNPPQPQPQTLTFDALVEALTPPAVPSLAHSRSLAAAITTQSPLPRPAVLNPVLASLCAADSPAPLQCAGYEVMAAYWERYEGKVSTADKLSYFSLFSRTLWSSEVGEPRLRALRALTKEGTDVLGIEILLLNLLKSWIEGAFEAYLFCDPSHRADRERNVELVASYMSSLLEHPETAARVSAGDLSSVLHFYASLVCKTMDIPSAISTSESFPTAPPFAQNEQLSSAKLASNGHKRHSSSISIRSVPPSSIPPSRHPAEIMVAIYLDHLHSQLKSLAPRMLTLILPLLFRAQAFFASPLPRLSVMNGRSHGPAGLEERIQKMLHSLFAGPYGASCMMILKRHLSPPTDETLDPQTLSTSFGAHRTLRFDIRQALGSKMARAYIARLSTVAYTPSGAPGQMDLEKDLMERAWSKDDLSGWDLLKLGRMLCKSMEAWAKRAATEPDEAIHAERDRILDEAAGTLKDIFQEFDEREDGADMDEEEASIAGETLRHLASFIRPLKNTDDTPMIIPLLQPSDAPTPFLRALTSLLARDHSTYMNPSLSTTLLSISDHLTDTDTAKLPAVMFEQHDLSPASPEWLSSWDSILSNATIFGLTRPLTRLEVMKALQAIYDSLKDMHSYRMALAELVFKFCQREANDGSEVSGSSVMWRILADEVVLRTVNPRKPFTEAASIPSPYTPTQEMIELLGRVAVDGIGEDDDDTASFNTSETPSPATYAAFSSGPSNAASPVLSRRQSEGYRNISGRDSGLTSVMSLISTLAGSRSQSQHSREQPDIPRPPFASSPSPEPEFTRASLAVVALVAIFSQLAFTPYSLTKANVDIASSVFMSIVETLTEARCPRARIAALQFLMRLRADRDHRVYFVEAHHDSEGLIINLASLIGRGPQSAHQDDRTLSLETSPEEFPLRRPRGVQERDGRRASRGRGAGPSQSGSSRSRSRAPLPISPPVSTSIPPKSRESLWAVPENLPFTAIDADTPSEGIVSYDEVQESSRVMPFDAYLIALMAILEKERNWEVLSYVLCHLPVQLANKHLLCGPKCRVLMAKLLTTLCSGVTTGDLGSFVDRWPLGLKARDAHGLAYHTLTVMISYRRCFDVPLRHALVDVLREGLNGQPSTIICCLHALTLSAFELTSSLKRSLPSLLEKLSQIMSNPDMAVHILSFLSIIGSMSQLHANLREDDFKMIFGVALQYLQYHNRPGATPTISWAMSQYVRMISFYVVYVWFLAVKLTDRPRHIPYITRQLLLANEGRPEVDEPTEVCFDWLARYTYASADPRPANSVLSEIVMAPTNSNSEVAISEKSWLMGNAIVTIRALARLGWIEVTSRRPSGSTKFICKLENVPLVGPGEVDPDMLSLPVGILMERELMKVERSDPSQETEQVQNGISVRLPSTNETREAISVPSEVPSVPAPNPITGYVWSKTAPSQRRKQVSVDPSFLPLQLSSYPYAPTHRRIIDESALPALFRNLDRTPVIDTHKVGIMYVAPGQSHELDILRNTHGSPAYTRFLEGIGRLINLRGQLDVYTGGLNSDEDGEYAYAWWDDIGQVLFHTATMMPNAEEDAYCVNKKRHIGNDYVRIVWNDGGTPYRFDTLATQFQFLNIVIEPHSLGAIAAFSDFRSTSAAAAPVDAKPPAPVHPAKISSHPGPSVPPHESENEYFKVTVQRASGMKDFMPIGCFKLISAENLPLLVRQLTLLGDWFAHVFERTERDEVEVEVITNWRQRLQVVKRFMKGMEEASGGSAGGRKDAGGGVIGQEASRNFTTAY
ncbi:hypothetical protein PAXRUDRAFT_145764 [Paxillus rubicundulus Ve08.2h10]|uniref:Unplaced genomic scaffold scaffold_390, whole genome shotgun sequence n=1 Tax=Paxillus rubicundulus Ve08.2h10 TaxID=930991 RepID=A0A0D0E644_9AGAM|nr:hypothetical protein PAXRUDRAFT_145764 [Paxillus rubicundulus Ve08.2h10]